MPPGRYDVGDEWPVLHAETTPSIRTDGWTLTVDRLVRTPCAWSWEEIRAIHGSRYEGDIHCVTAWSKFGITFDGVCVDTLLELAGPLNAEVGKDHAEHPVRDFRRRPARKGPCHKL